MAARARKRKRGSGRPGDARARSRRRLPLGLILVLLLCAAFVAHALAFRFTQDDAYISLRYAKNLVDGHGLVFNPGERLEGYTNFSWTLLLALVLKLGLPPIAAATWLGIAFAVGAIFWAARLARAIEGAWGPASVLTAALVAGTSAFALWSTGGLETALFTLLVTGAIERGTAPGVGTRGRAAAAALFCLAAFTRPEAPLLFALWLAMRAADTLSGAGPLAEPRGVRGLLRDVLVFSLPLVPYAAWKLWYFGDLLPNTFYAKAGASLEYLNRGIAYTREYFGDYALFGVAPALALLAVARAGLRSVEARILLIWAGVAAYVIVVGGDVLHVHRFWLPILPAGCVLVARGADIAGKWLALRAGRRHLSAGFATAIVAVLVGTGLARNWSSIQSRRATEIGFVENMTETGRWLAQNFPPDAKVAITTVGAISYYSGLHIIDMLGLTDREVARHPKRIEGLADTWREINYNAESVLRRRPDLILFSTGVRPSAAGEKALFLYGDFERSYYAYYFRATPNRVNSQVGFRLRPDAPPFRDDILDVPSLAFLDAYSDGHLVQSRQHDYKTAAEHFQRSWELSGEQFHAAREWLGSARYDGGQPDGAEILREVAAQDSFSVVALSRLGDAALRGGDTEGAIRIFERVTQVDSADAVGWMGLAQAARMQGDWENGYQAAARGIRRWDAGTANLLLFGELALRTGRVDPAEQAFRRALAIDPGLDRARQFLAVVDAVRHGEPLPQQNASDGAAAQDTARGG